MRRNSTIPVVTVALVLLFAYPVSKIAGGFWIPIAIPFMFAAIYTPFFLLHWAVWGERFSKKNPPDSAKFWEQD